MATTPPPPPKRGPGRPPNDPSGTQKKCYVRLSPAEERHMIDRYGSVNAGLRALVARDMTSRQK